MACALARMRRMGALAAAALLLVAGPAGAQQDNAANGRELANRIAALIGATDACGDDDHTAALIRRYQQLLEGLGRQGLMGEEAVRELERTGRETARQVRENYQTTAGNCDRAAEAAGALLDSGAGTGAQPRRSPEI